MKQIQLTPDKCKADTRKQKPRMCVLM